MATTEPATGGRRASRESSIDNEKINVQAQEHEAGFELGQDEVDFRMKELKVVTSWTSTWRRT